ncbi:MAG: copper oxidase [Rhodopseudomonas palustris]|uniref:Copper oxidase n=1 Tax=Rhodopseudomonas palustris TaxID=1076 RepID=A0A933RX09_RHOPL|nr:copper oxidase [Rhodopseudomonas palustris]
MKISRRKVVAASGAVIAGVALERGSVLAQTTHEEHQTQMLQPAPQARNGPDSHWIDVAKGTQHPARTIPPGEAVPPGEPGRDYNPVITPNGITLPFKLIDGVKVFHLVAEEVTHEFAPGLKVKLWGFNGRVHGPTIEAVEGDLIRIYVTNKLPEATSVHWHGIILPNGMDGVGGLNQRTIRPGETFKYEYPLLQYGTHMYHSHFDEMTQMGLGVMGLFIIHPRRPAEPRPDRDFAIMLSEWDVKPGAYRPDPRVFAGFNTLTFNAKSFPATEPLVAKRGDRVRIRLGNLGAMDHHPIHLHGHSFWVTQSDGGLIPTSARWPETTVLVSVGQSRTVDFVADNPGDWAFHCHMTHHVMNQMGHEGPNLIGVDPHKLSQAVKPLIPGFMPMGTSGMGDMSQTPTERGSGDNMRMSMPGMAHGGMHGDSGAMAVPKNSIAMMGGPGPYGTIDMGGMLAVFKVREKLESYADPGWYEPPAGTVAQVASEQDLQRDGIVINAQRSDRAQTAKSPKMDHMNMPGMKH